MNEESMLDPSLLESLTKEQRQEALAAAAAAKRAEERAEQRALERAMQRKAEERKRLQLEQNEQLQKNEQDSRFSRKKISVNPGIVFVSKRKRQKMEEEKEKEALTNDSAPTETTLKKPPPPPTSDKQKVKARGDLHTSSSSSSTWKDKERAAVRQTYLGKSSMNKNKKELSKRKEKNERKKKKGILRTKKATFRFAWDNEDDTLDDFDPLYAKNIGVVSRIGRTNKKKKMQEDSVKTTQSLYNKPLTKMTSRDWRIFRENFEITVKGGQAPPPLRNFREADLHPSLLDAVENVMRYRDPTPIQRASIPIQLERRDLIGIAETGSGKTLAFGLPLLSYILNLPSKILNKVADDGPLALVMAPTRELALQIHGEFQKMLSRQSRLKTAVVVGGQSIQHQAQQLREGIHVVVGTPGRLNDCLESAYMVLNQCRSVVLDEADRMIDMGFAPQMESILDAMGGSLKSENEKEASKQQEEDLTKKDNLPRHRLMGMFTATMPLEVERIAKRYLRHPAIISIGDQDSGKNKRIIQRIIYLSSPAKKESALRDLLMNPRYLREKVIVFVNEKKHADGVGRMVERMGRPCVVLHGGKSQDQREENLQTFRKGGVVLVATDVAGRGLDIPDVAHVINFDLPSRSIDSYSHRIGRTGRAGKEGLATSLMTDEDEGIMARLKAYLESTGNPVPNKLARHPAANANTQGNLIH